MKTGTRRSIVGAVAAALVLTSLGLGPAQAAAAKSPGQPQVAQAGTTTDFSARRWHRGNRAALGAVVGVFGAIAALAAADQYRNGYYYGDPGYGYGYGYGYAPGYRYGRWHHHHWR